MKSVKINVKKLDKARFFAGKEGSLYCDLVLFENKSGEPDQFGNDGFVTQSCSKEEREGGLKMPIIGSWKRLGGKKKPAPTAAEKRKEDDDNDPPF